MSTSGTYSFNPALADILLESFDRIQIRPPEIGAHHMTSAKMSANLVLTAFQNRGVNLWKVDLVTVPLVQGVTTYSVPSNTVMVLDSYVRQYSMNGPTNVTLPAFSTSSGFPTVTVTLANNGLLVGEYINIVIPVSIGGLILYGFYQVASVTSSSTFTFTAASNATSTVSSGGAVPFFTTSANSTTISVLLPNHGYVAGQSFVVQVSTSVGGVVLFGTYTILGITDANHFTFTASYAAGSSASVYENNGQAQIAGQQTNSDPVDRIIMPISRTDYASLADKYQQGFPTVYWFDRLLSPTITIWQVPDGNGPYALMYYRVTQIQDANPVMGQTVDLPTRFLEAFCAEMSWHLARKWKPELEASRKVDAQFSWAEAAAEDRERVSMYFQPEFDGYFN